jgi:ribonuclease HII
MLVAGVDEAGRGCLIGPLVICLYSVEEEEGKKLRALGARDSKELTLIQRETAFSSLKPFASEALVKKVSAKELTEAMQKKVSLNELEAIKIAELIAESKAERVIVDSPDGIAENFKKRIERLLPSGRTPEIISSHKADSKFPVVSAASVIAKVERDAEIEALKRRFGDFGSGYTSDPRTMEFMRKNFRKPELQEFLRHKWKTMKEFESVQVKLSEFA